MYKVGLALLALVFSVFFLPCLFSFFLFLLAYFFPAFLAEIGRSITPFENESTEGKFRPRQGPLLFSSAHGRCYL